MSGELSGGNAAHSRRAPCSQGLCQPWRSEDLVARELSDNPFEVSTKGVWAGGSSIVAGGPSTVIHSVLDLPKDWRLHHGDALVNPRVAFRLAGPRDAPVVAGLGGISAHRYLIGPEGWWPEIVGPNLGVDTTRFRVLGIDYLGGLGLSSTPDGGSTFPPVSSFDQAEVLCRVVLHLGLSGLHAIVGASYGGMVALSFAARHAALVDRIVIVSAADRAQVLSTAWRSVQRQIVRDAIARRDGAAGLKLARALAVAT